MRIRISTIAPLVASAALFVSGCIFGVSADTDADASGTSDTTAETELGPDAVDCRENPDHDSCRCNYDNSGRGVCGDSRIVDGTCQKPEQYQSDESKCDDLDNDCDGTTDELCSCNYNSTGNGVCGRAVVSPDSGDCAPPDEYESTESSCDGIDNDCDGETDGDDSDVSGCSCSEDETKSCYTGASGTAGKGICEEGTRHCTSEGGQWEASCDGDVTPEPESRSNRQCNNKDDDCDGVTDEGCPCTYDKTQGVCADAYIRSDGECRPPNSYESGGEDSCCDELDNDCDGNADRSDGRDCALAVCS